MNALIGIALFLVAAVAMWFLNKVLPKIVRDILDLALFVWLLTILLSSTSGIDAPQKFLESIPMVEYLVTFGAGAKLGAFISNLF